MKLITRNAYKKKYFRKLRFGRGVVLRDTTKNVLRNRAISLTHTHTPERHAKTVTE